ncbi:MAG: substrate-binding domain-containing protein, partial [Woeseiaceae bacterium]
MRLATLFFALFFQGATSAETLTVAVASNFVPTARELARDFTAETGYEVRISSGSTGKLH